MLLMETNHKHKLNNVICRFFYFLLVDSAELCVYLYIELQGDQTTFRVFELLYSQQLATEPKPKLPELSLHPCICFLLRFILMWTSHIAKVCQVFAFSQVFWVVMHHLQKYITQSIEMWLDNKVTQSVVINKGVCQGCLFSLLVTVKCMHKWNNVRMEQGKYKEGKNNKK